MRKPISLLVIIFTMLLTLTTLNSRPISAQDEVTCENDYIVQADDWLSKIAEKTYGDVLAYPAIFEATNAKAATDDSYATIENADVIEVGWNLCLPSAEVASTMTGESMMTEDGESMAMDSSSDSFHPVPFPDNLGIPGFNFPEPEATIIGWTTTNDLTSINKHGWGLWVGLNTISDQTFEGQSLRVFETWYTPTDIQCVAGLRSASDPKCAGVDEGLRNPRPLDELHQLSGTTAGEQTVVGFVKYDPTAVEHTIQQELFNAQVLSQLLAAGETDIPDFPATAITIKPAFTTLCDPTVAGCTKNTLDAPIASQDGRYYQIRIWPGSIYDAGFPTAPDTAGFGYGSKWTDCVWIDTQNESAAGAGLIDEGCSGSPETVMPYNVDDFINFKDSSTDHYHILSGMHVTSRETRRWTWQTFWWTPTPDSPKLPSSQEIADHRPEQLTGAPRHYAMAIGYSMVNPAQPVTGGKNEGESIYAFNPHLEAVFGTSALPDSSPNPELTYEGQLVPNNVGVESNCMSCHAQARYPDPNPGGSTFYTGNRYIDIEAPYLTAEGNPALRVDLLWSITANAITPTTTTP